MLLIKLFLDWFQQKELAVFVIFKFHFALVAMHLLPMALEDPKF
jgi:hypothetical protein